MRCDKCVTFILDDEANYCYECNEWFCHKCINWKYMKENKIENIICDGCSEWYEHERKCKIGE